MKKIVKLLLKTAGVLVLLALIVFGTTYAIFHEPLPEGTLGPKADALAEKMLKVINYEQFQKTKYIEWSFIDSKHQYKWDKEMGLVEVKWGDNKVNLNLSQPQRSLVFENNIEIKGSAKDALINKATGYFNNDSFWLVAPFKVFDKGTERSILVLEDGSKGLLVTYTSGGSTPGDSYLWKLNNNGFPESYQMWVKVIPIGGIEASWDDWKVMESGVFLPTTHQLGPINMSMGDVKAYN